MPDIDPVTGLPRRETSPPRRTPAGTAGAARGYTYSPLYDELKAELEAEIGDATTGAARREERLKERHEKAKNRKRPLSDTERTAEEKEDMEDADRAALQKAFDDIRPPPSFDPPMDQVGLFRGKLEAYRTARAVKPARPAARPATLPNETADEREQRLATEQDRAPRSVQS